MAVVFPGQGSQYPGMADPWLSDDAARAVLTECSDAVGYDLIDACRDEHRLTRTDIVQPALFACGVAAYRVLEGEGIRPTVVAGHSLGEYAALVAAGVLELRPAVEAVAERGAAMQEAADAAPGAMTALLGLSPEEAAEVCRIAGRGDVLAVANENSPRQTVLSGTTEAIERAEALARTRKVKAVRLKVAGGFHSPLVQAALPRVRAAIAGLTFHTPAVPVIPNVSGRPATSPQELRDLLSRQLLSPVRWSRTMDSIVGSGAGLLLEAGPSDVLARLARRSMTGVRAVAVGSPAEVRALLSEAEVPAR
ncbi:MAG TPA: ACP S-malonyltransferase [Actinomycetota bacterium]|nr:ACP S-malonyltransferase [Actinomycetota bacterium]